MNRDQRPIQQVALPVIVVLVIAIQLVNRALGGDRLITDDVESLLPALLALAGPFFAVAAWAIVRKTRISKVIRKPQAISRVEQNGDKVVIHLADGKAIDFAVKRVLPFPFYETSGGLEALGPIAPHAVERVS